MISPKSLCRGKVNPLLGLGKTERRSILSGKRHAALVEVKV
jgi:hypothetical protein